MLQDITKERLLKLCDYMEALPAEADKHFRMRAYISHNGEGHRHEIPSAPSIDDLLTCGTSACALGWACTMPEFRSLGLHIDPDGYMPTVDGYNVVFPGLEAEYDDEGHTAWADLFEGYNKDETPKAWAIRARGLIAKWEEKAA